MPDILIPPCLLPLFIGLYQTFINSGSIFELNDIPIDKLERLSNQIMYSPLYYHFLSNVTNNKNLESTENLANNIDEMDDDEDNNYNLDRYTKHAQLIYSQASSYETINSMGSSRQDLSNDLKSYQSSTSTKVMSYSHTGYAMLQSGSSNMTSTMTNTITNNSMTNTNISSTSTRNMPGQPKCLFNYEEMNFEEDEAMSLEINLSCTLFDEILDTIYHRIYEYSYLRFISDNKNRKLVHNTLKNIHKQRKRRKNGRSNSRSGTLRNTTSQTTTSNNASCSQTKENSSSKHHNKTNSTGSFMKFNESNNKSYSSHHTHTKSGHHKYTQSYSSNRNNNNDFDNTEDDGNAASNNVKYNNEEPNFDNGGTGKLFVVGYGSMNENQINTQTSYEVINKTIKSMNNIQNDNINSISQNDQENCFNTYPLNNASNKGKRPFDTVNSTNSDLNQYSDAIQTNQNNNNQYDNIPSISNTTINNNNSNNSNSNSNNSENVSNNSNDNNSLLPPFQFGSSQMTNFHRNSLMEIKRIKRDIVFTIRKTVEIIIKGASKYLPGESRLIIRRFILSLPSRLSKLTQKVKTPECITSTTATTTATTSTITTTTTTTNINGKMMDTNSSVISSPASSYMTDEPDTKKQSNDDNTLNAINATKEESLKIMTLATEGNDMLKKMMDVFEKSFQENNKNNLDNINLVNSNEYSTFNYNTNKILYNPLQNNNKYNKLGNNNFNTEITTNTTSVTTTTTSNSNYIMSYDESLNNFTNNH